MAYARLTDDAARAVADALADRSAGILASTSGTTGDSRELRISGAAMRASANATLARLGGPGHWLLALPPTRIAGAMVLARAQVGGKQVEQLPAGPFTAAAFVRAAKAMPPGRRYVSLVPTQLRRVLADGDARAALAEFDAVLVGGAAPGMDLPSNAIETYGMTETCGGCVYDGAPLDGVEVRIGADGRVEVTGPMLADGYVDGDDSAFVTEGGVRWLRTEDLGEVVDGRLRVLGRADDAILTGGVTVHPAEVERALLALPHVTDCAVVGVPDPEWGQAVAAVVASSNPPSLAHLRGVLALPRASLPRIVTAVDAVPRTAAGKIDRERARAIAASAATPTAKEDA